jgi:hypothetical protein
VPSRGSRFPQATLVPMRLKVPPPYRGRPHPGDHRSVCCRPVRDGFLRGGRSSRCARVPPPLLPCRALASPRAPAAPLHGPRRSQPLAADVPRAGRLQRPTNPRNQAPDCRRPFPYPPRPGSGDTSPEFCSNRAGYRHRGDIARLGFFPGGQLQNKGLCIRI